MVAGSQSKNADHCAMSFNYRIFPIYALNCFDHRAGVRLYGPGLKISLAENNGKAQACPGLKATKLD